MRDFQRKVEWEWAARAGTTGAVYEDLDRIAWYKANSGDKTHPAGEKGPNGWGLRDILGNVWEWVADWYAPYSRGSEVDPIGLTAPTDAKVLRGGSWNNIPLNVRVSYRVRDVPTFRDFYIGFRCAWELR